MLMFVDTQQRARFAIVAALVVTLAGCESATRPTVNPGVVAGSYVLESVTGRGPVSGTFALTADGVAERRVQYTLYGGALSSDFVALGTFTVRADSIEFALREDGGRSPYVWRPSGARAANGFSVVYGDPADGPSIVETYRRQ
jgi:hypothetical protein